MVGRDVLNGVGGGFRGVELNGVYRFAVDEGVDAEVEVGRGASDGRAGVGVSGADLDDGWITAVYLDDWWCVGRFRIRGCCRVRWGRAVGVGVLCDPSCGDHRLELRGRDTSRADAKLLRCSYAIGDEAFSEPCNRILKRGDFGREGLNRFDDRGDEADVVEAQGAARRERGRGCRRNENPGKSATPAAR